MILLPGKIYMARSLFYPRHSQAKTIEIYFTAGM